MTQTKFIGRKKVAIVNNSKKQSRQIANELKQKLEQNHFMITDKTPDIVISIGGDGALLSAFHNFERQLHKVRFIGVHTGHLGFYTDYRDYEIDKLVEDLTLDKGSRISYPLVNIKLFLGNDKIIRLRALNESTFKSLAKTMVADISINNHLFERFRGDGLSVATPTGSTAYNKSIGGAIVHPNIEALQLTEIASLNNRVYRALGSSIIIPKRDNVEVIPRKRVPYLLTVDNKSYTFKNVKKVEYRIDNKKINFVASPNHINFWERVKDSFIGDIRE